MLIFMTPPRLCDKANGFHLCKILDYAGLVYQMALVTVDEVPV